MSLSRACTLIYPHQLFEEHPGLASGRDVFLVEDPLLLSHNPAHALRLLLLKQAMDAYEVFVRDSGYTVYRIAWHASLTSKDIFATIAKRGYSSVHILDVVDDFLERVILNSASHHSLALVWHESPGFILSSTNAKERYVSSKKHMAAFYKMLRKEYDLLMDGTRPLGGKWSFDADNRKSLPSTVSVPSDLALHEARAEDSAWVHAISEVCDVYGDPSFYWCPFTFNDARDWLNVFFEERFSQFGVYEDAMSDSHVRLFHSTISPLMNIGLLTPRFVLDSAIAYAKEHSIPLNSLEGFVRQILGWREFIRAAYVVDGRFMRTKNHFQFSKRIPKSFWSGKTGIPPVDHVIQTALKYGYTHHIERLMVMGNYMLLTRIAPKDVYAWFMGMYIDAYDWVMVPNVYGMSQFADGGIFATKPYISGASYITKMSNYKKGDWEDIWTALYWQFIHDHEDLFAANHRMRMMVSMYQKFDTAKKREISRLSKEFI